MTEPRWLAPAARVLPSLAVAVLALRTHVRNADWQDELLPVAERRGRRPRQLQGAQGLGQRALGRRPRRARRSTPPSRAPSSAWPCSTRSRSPRSAATTRSFTTSACITGARGTFSPSARSRARRGGSTSGPSPSCCGRGRWTIGPTRPRTGPSLSRGRPPGDLQDVGNFRIYLELGLAYLRLGNWAEAETACRYAQRLAPAEVDGYLFVGAARYYAGTPRRGGGAEPGGAHSPAGNSDGVDQPAKCYEALGARAGAHRDQGLEPSPG